MCEFHFEFSTCNPPILCITLRFKGMKRRWTLFFPVTWILYLLLHTQTKTTQPFSELGLKIDFGKKNRIRGNNHLLWFKPLHRIELNCFYFAIFFIGQYLRRVLPYLEFWLVTLTVAWCNLNLKFFWQKKKFCIVFHHEPDNWSIKN